MYPPFQNRALPQNLSNSSPKKIISCYPALAYIRTSSKAWQAWWWTEASDFTHFQAIRAPIGAYGTVFLRRSQRCSPRSQTASESSLISSSNSFVRLSSAAGVELGGSRACHVSLSTAPVSGNPEQACKAIRGLRCNRQVVSCGVISFTLSP